MNNTFNNTNTVNIVNNNFNQEKIYEVAYVYCIKHNEQVVYIGSTNNL
jgi:hypothetical protein